MTLSSLIHWCYVAYLPELIIFLLLMWINHLRRLLKHTYTIKGWVYIMFAHVLWFMYCLIRCTTYSNGTLTIAVG